MYTEKHFLSLSLSVSRGEEDKEGMKQRARAYSFVFF